MDSDALYGQYGIALAGVIDLQLMELASRFEDFPWNNGRLESLRRCLALDAEMGEDERNRVLAIKERGKRLFAREHSGSYEAFRVRPLSQEVIDYCVVDVAYMPNLYKNYNLMLENTVSLVSWGYWSRRIIEATEKRVAQAQGTEFRGSPCLVYNNYDSQAAQDEFLDQQMYTSDYTENAPFQLHNVGRIDGSTISNSPRSSRSPISKSSSQESFLYTQAASNARRPCNPGSVGSLPELMFSKNSRDRSEHAVDQITDNLTYLNPSDCPLDSQQMSTAQRRRSKYHAFQSQDHRRACATASSIP